MSQPRLIALLVYPGVTALDVVAPMTILSQLRTTYRTTLVSEFLFPMSAYAGVQLTPNLTLDEAATPFVLLVPGGDLGLFKAMASPRLQEYLAAVAESAQLVASVSTGSLLLAASGLLVNRRATTHWGYASMLERLGARYDPEHHVEDGKFITAAGPAAGTNAALLLVSHLAGEATAEGLRQTFEQQPCSPRQSMERDVGSQRLMAHLSTKEAKGRLEAIRLVLAPRPNLLQKLGL